MRYLRNRIAVFCNLPISSIDALALGSKLRAIGAMDGSHPEILRGRMTDLSRRLTAEPWAPASSSPLSSAQASWRDALTTDDAVALLGNTLPTGAILVVLITIWGRSPAPISTRPCRWSLPCDANCRQVKHCSTWWRRSPAALPAPLPPT